jgi:hypothetical protein
LVTLLLTANVAADLSERPSLASAPDRVPFAFTTDNVLLLAEASTDPTQVAIPKHIDNDDDGEQLGHDVAMHESHDHGSADGHHDERDHEERHEQAHDHDRKDSKETHSARERIEREHEDESAHER